MMSTITEQLAPRTSSDGARKNAPVAPAPKSGDQGRPVPDKGDKREKAARKEKTENHRSKTFTSTERPPINKQATSGGKPTNAGPSSRESKVPEKLASRSTDKETWSQVVGRKARKKAKQMPKPTAVPSSASTNALQKKKEKKNAPGIRSNKPGKKKRRRIPRTSAVVLSAPSGDYDKLMAEVRV
ncbi:hypothetical protein PUN28_020376 [Cardiocondyla obscurior]|uniref:Uncharacterized protein n=1 Tax=Cardiocondyla obscurior TaxID=286306 RepID=A0AAW2E649_9HYME